MKNTILKRAIPLLCIVSLIFSFCGCKTIKAAVSFKWGKRTGSEHHLEAKKDQREYPSALDAGFWIISKQ